MMENQTALIRGKRIVAMSADDTSVAQMLHLLGVEPTSELVAEYVLENAELDMKHIHAFLVKKGIMSDVEGVVADLRGVQLTSAPIEEAPAMIEAEVKTTEAEVKTAEAEVVEAEVKTAEVEETGVQEPIPPESAGEPAAEPAVE